MSNEEIFRRLRKLISECNGCLKIKNMEIYYNTFKFNSNDIKYTVECAINSLLNFPIESNTPITIIFDNSIELKDSQVAFHLSKRSDDMNKKCIIYSSVLDVEIITHELIHHIIKSRLYSQMPYINKYLEEAICNYYAGYGNKLDVRNYAINYIQENNCKLPIEKLIASKNFTIQLNLNPRFYEYDMGVPLIDYCVNERHMTIKQILSIPNPLIINFMNKALIKQGFKRTGMFSYTLTTQTSLLEDIIKNKTYKELLNVYHEDNTNDISLRPIVYTKNKFLENSNIDEHHMYLIFQNMYDSMITKKTY